MDIIYRPMHLSDIEKVWELFEVIKLEKAEVSLVEVPNKEELKNWLHNGNVFFYIAIGNDTSTGERVLSVLRGTRGSEPGTRHGVLLSVVTHPDFRNQGIARDLINFGLEDMKMDGVTLARAYIYSDNIPSFNTVLKLGFTFGGTVYRHHFNEKTQEYVDDLIFHKIL